MKNILLPTDFSDNAWNAIEYALQLFKDDACTFYLLNSYSIPLAQPTSTVTSVSTTKVLVDLAVEASEKGLNATLYKISKNYSNKKHQFTLVSDYDFFLGAVKNIVKEKNIDFIVMGTKGASGIKEVMIGSNTAGVIARVGCPILAIPEKAKYKPIKEIAFATEYDYFFEKHEVQPLTEITKKQKASIKILHILGVRGKLTKDQEEIKRYLGEKFSDVLHDFYTLTRVSLETGIRVFIQSRNIGMLCMIAKHHNFFERLFGKPRVEEISFHIKIPYLILHEYNSHLG